METRAIQRYVRITPRKCNQVLGLIRGMTVEQAQITLQFTPKQGARIVQKVLKSAVANALHEGKVRIEDLFVKEAVVGAGPTLKRWLPRAQGRATPILKRMSQKTHPIGLRLGINKTWDSRWFGKRNYAELLREDLLIKRYLKKRLFQAGISKITIERKGDRVTIGIRTARPGLVIGRKGEQVDKLSEE